jgi:hypothetical protein
MKGGAVRLAVLGILPLLRKLDDENRRRLAALIEQFKAHTFSSLMYQIDSRVTYVPCIEMAREYNRLLLSAGETELLPESECEASHAIFRMQMDIVMTDIHD